MEMIISALFGTTTGILGTVISRVFAWLEVKQKIELTKIEHLQELELVKLQQAGQQAEMENELMLADIDAWKSARNASYRHDSNYGESYKWVTSILRMVRPILTAILALMTWYVFRELIDTEAQIELANQIVFMTTTAVAWWFGDRGRMNR